MHEHARVCEQPSAITVLLPNLTHDHELYQGMASSGLTYLTYRLRVKQGEEKSEAQPKKVAMHLCVCLITLI